ncbi:TetR/AcrR family transcriptional regulator [Kocuria rhizophila]|uniref:TetR/AcrR family transcriptional regulator n=1 Tax=Kocuria rhizophila TaxID=72000 RepID=UPI0007502AD2|nr:TetR/AcrR family transcriptional regulator [Kocuria rhizophila]KUP27434.1 TetR family transcriptional regulator [Kocuria rhizophila]MCG7424234.1 TetR/AcrR family transcriptional regulator [Kocuria rhizophila]MCT1457248.1 TetR/AcrR family transcriptional regulator [Kocuria rhizophila]MCT1880433.1 TetR/AcrR family transcriptional regulator [Kocuria rhizophila]MCT2249217.1 TetR/AcrR family transcriptional regulator [Kocuria rhizophila]
MSPERTTATADDAAAAPRRGRPGYDRETLLAVCVDVFNRYGYDATSMGMLSKHLGISKSAIYHHVESKEEILGQALDRALDALEAVFAEVLASDSGPVVKLERILDGSVRVLVAQMPYVTLLLRLRGNSEVEEAALQRRRTLTRNLEDLVREAQELGELRSDISGKSAPRLMLGMVNSIVDWYQPGRSGTVDQLAATVVTMVFAGLRA